MSLDPVELALTCEGGHLGPVTFRLGKKHIQPFHIAPWAEERRVRRNLPPVLAHLRGDFFCLPFGGNGRPWRGQNHPIHGETANRTWKIEHQQTRGDLAHLRCSLRMTIRPGQVIKEIFLRRGQPVVYQRHTIQAGDAPLCPGHHAMLRLDPDWGPAYLSTSPFCHGQVYPGQFENPASGGYSSLRPGAVFRSLRRIPRMDGSFSDWSILPAEDGYENLVLLASRPNTPHAWAALTFPRAGWLWFALKNPRTLASTVLWHSNGGRHYPPWNGRHRRVIGIEDVTAYFHDGQAESASPNSLRRHRIPTCLYPNRKRPLAIPYIFGIAAIPPSFGHVRRVGITPGDVTFHGTDGSRVTVPVDTTFLNT